MNPTASILKYMSEMDFEMLSLILDENKTYQEATKEVFIWLECCTILATNFMRHLQYVI